MKAMKQTQLSRVGRRRFNSRARYLVSLLTRSEELFRREWEKLVRGWLNEVHRRAKNWSEGAEMRNVASADGLAEKDGTLIFGVLEAAEALLFACGDDVEKLVGEETRKLITNECVKAVARLWDPRLNYMVNQGVYRRAK